MERMRLKVSLKELLDWTCEYVCMYVCLFLRTCVEVGVGELQRDFKEN